MDDRTTVLTLSHSFHWKAEEYSNSVPSWAKECENLQIPDEVGRLEDRIHQHQALWDSIMQKYSEVSYSLLKYHFRGACAIFE